MKRCAAILFVALLMCLAALPVNGAGYTYNSEGKAAASPDAFRVQKVYKYNDIGTTAFSGAADIKISPSGRVAVSDTAGNRIIMFNTDGSGLQIFDSFLRDGKRETFMSPSGMFYTSDGRLFVCDRGHGRILEFDRELKFLKSIENLNKTLLPEGFSFNPSAVAADKWGTVYCISYSSTNGYLRFDSSGEFRGFQGSPKTSLSVAEKFWYKFMTKEQKERKAVSVPVNFNYLAVDSDGFVYTTETNANVGDTAAAVKNGEKSGLFMPVKKFNFSGSDILKRKDNFAPAGDIDFETGYAANERESGELWASDLSYIELGEQGIYYVIDSKRNKTFCYDPNGVLLYAFGGTGNQTGMFSKLTAISYYGGKLYALDSNNSSVTVFEETEYGTLLRETVIAAANKDNTAAKKGWKELLSLNGNLTAAYTGLGKIYLGEKNYSGALKCFSAARDRDNYSVAFSKQRTAFLNRMFILIPIASAALLSALVFLFGRLARYNAAKRTGTLSELAYGQYIIFHPFDGFWDARRENRGSPLAAGIFMLAAALCTAFQIKISGMVSGTGKYVSFLLIAAVFLGALAVFCISNRCITSLSDGKGSFADIFTVAGYSVIPIILTSSAATLLSAFLSGNESGIITVLLYFGYIWTVFLLFSGILTVHQYGFFKNICSMLLTVIGMAVIVFLIFLLINLLGRIFNFADSIITELRLR